MPAIANVETEDLAFPSSDGVSTVVATIWRPGDAGGARPKAIVQFVHGMAEHISRYDDFARYLVRRGFVVCGEDMIGHGRSVQSEDGLGCLPLEGGMDVLVADMHALQQAVAGRYPADVPYIMYGHSMGSFIVRAFLARHGEDVAAAVLSGAGNPPRAASLLGRFLARRIAARRGAGYRSAFIDGMGAGGYGRRIEDARTPYDWLSCDAAAVDRYIADPYCGFMFSVGGYSTLLELTAWVVTPDCAARVPRGLPILLASGALDPVGECGKGVHAAAELLRRAGVAQVDERLYPGMRHEIHNEADHGRVYADMASWMEGRL